MTSLSSSPSLAAHWQSVRRLFPIYTELADKFELGNPPFANLDKSGGKSEAEVIARIEGWFAEMDQRIQAHEFRQMLQSAGIVDAEEKLHALISHHLAKTERVDADRDKLDFLLTQYVSVCSPPSFQMRELSLEEVRQVLESVLGECSPSIPRSVEPLETLIREMTDCRDLGQFELHKIPERGRELKMLAGEEFFTRNALVAFTRFNYILRYTFARLFAIEAQSIDKGLQELEARGITSLDASDAGLSPDELITTIRELVQDTITSVAPAYSSGRVDHRLRILRKVVDKNLALLTSTRADDARFEKVESELEKLRCAFVQLRSEWEHLRITLTTAEAHDRQRPSAVSRDVANIAHKQQAVAGTDESPPTSTHTAVDQSPQLPRSEPASIDASVALATSEVGAPPATPRKPSLTIDDVNAETAQYLERLRKAVRSAGTKVSALVRFGTATMLLSDGEAQLLQSKSETTDEVTQVIEGAVALRALLMVKCELSRSDQEVELGPYVQRARDVLGELQRLSAMHGPRHQLVTMTAKQLMNVIQQADKAARHVYK